LASPLNSSSENASVKGKATKLSRGNRRQKPLFLKLLISSKSLVSSTENSTTNPKSLNLAQLNQAAQVSQRGTPGTSSGGSNGGRVSSSSVSSLSPGSSSALGPNGELLVPWQWNLKDKSQFLDLSEANLCVKYQGELFILERTE
jgi:hypothetical protein